MIFYQILTGIRSPSVYAVQSLYLCVYRTFMRRLTNSRVGMGQSNIGQLANVKTFPNCIKALIIHVCVLVSFSSEIL